MLVSFFVKRTVHPLVKFDSLPSPEIENKNKNKFHTTELFTSAMISVIIVHNIITYFFVLSKATVKAT